MELYRGKAVILGGYDDSIRRRSDGEMWNMDTETWEEADISLNIARYDFSLVTMAEEAHDVPHVLGGGHLGQYFIFICNNS